MDLKKYIRGNYTSLFHTLPGEEINQNTCVLLGYKDGIPVLGKDPAIVANKTPKAKQTVKVEVDEKTGEKYINLNGKRLRMVTGSEIPAHLKSIKAAPQTNPSEKKPVKIKIIGSMPGMFQRSDTNITSLKATVNIIDNESKLSPKPVLIRDSDLTTTKVPSAGKVVVTDRLAVERDSAGVIPENDRRVKARIINYSGGILKSLNGVLKMNPLDLSKVSSKPEVKKEDKSVQTSPPETVDECLQTDFEDEFLLNLLNTDFLDVLSSNTTSLTPAVTAPPKMVVATTPTQAHSEKFKMFFQDLRTAMVPDMNGNRPIHVAVLKNDVCHVKRCCSVLKALQTPVDILNHGDLTALQLAILNDANPQIIKVLLAHSASLEAVDSEGNNVIHLAIECRRTETLDTLLRFADEQKFNLNDFNAEGLTPLMISCCNNLPQCADLLLKYDADVDVRDRKSGRTALFHAAENHNLEMVQLLLTYNANTKIKNFFGTSPHEAMYEVDEIPESIKAAILGKNAKRKNGEEPKVLKVRRVEENMNKLKTYARFKKVDYEFPMMASIAAKAK